MMRLAHRADKEFRTRFPTAYYHLVQRPRLAFAFRKEQRLAGGAQLSGSQQASILFFTTHKCASRYTSSVLSQLAESAGLVHADYDAYVTMRKVPKHRHPFSAAVNSAFQPRGYYYGPIGSYRPIPRMEEYRVLLQLRDPRDLLTSLYYSTAYSHAIISPKLIRRRKDSLQLDIDSFVLQGAQEYESIFNGYIANLLEKPGVLFVKYEDMVTDLPAWLERVSAHLGVDKDPDAIARILSQANFSVSREDKHSQKRQVSPGDHRRKLRPETIAQLNQRLASILQALGYSE